MCTPRDCKIKPVSPKGNQSWIFIGWTDAEAAAPILWPPDEKNWLTGKRPWCWERLKAGGEGDDRGWDGWMASLTWGTWVWASSRSWWWTGKPGMLQSLGLQRVGYDWVTELTELTVNLRIIRAETWGQHFHKLSIWGWWWKLLRFQIVHRHTYPGCNNQ